MFKNLEGFKKIHEDKDKTIMQHKAGHFLTIAHKPLSGLKVRQLKSLPLHECSGGAIMMATGGQAGPPMPTGEPVSDEDAAASAANNQAAADQQALQQKYPAQPVPNQTMASNDDESDEGEDPDPTDAKDPLVPVPDEDAAPTSTPIATAAAAQSPDINVNDAYKKQLAGNQGIAQAQSNLAQTNAQLERDQQKYLVDAQANWNTKSQYMMKDVNDALTDARNGHINPKQYLENMGAGQKVATAIGLFLGGLSTPYTHQGNPALDMLNKQIDRDVDAQKAGLNNKMNVYHAYLDKYHNAAAAENMTRATEFGIYASKLREASATNGSAVAKAQGQLGAGQLEQNMIPLINNAHLLHEMGQFNGSTPGPTGTEAQYKVALNAAQQINPGVYKDQQSKYIPGVGISQIPVSKEDISELATYKNLNDLAKQAQDFAQTNGRTMWGTDANQQANDLSNNMRLQLGQLVNLKRINEYEAKKYDDMIRSPGSWNNGSAIQSFKDMRSDIAGKTQALGNKLGIKPFRKP